MNDGTMNDGATQGAAAEKAPDGAPVPWASRVFTAALLLTGLAVLGLSVWITIVYPLARPAGADGNSAERVAFAMPAGGRVDELSAALSSAGLIEHPDAFAAYVRFRGARAKLRVHGVVLRRGMAPAEVLGRLTEGGGLETVRVPIPEGFDRYQIAERLEANEVCLASEFRALTAGDEGFLFPDTYEFSVPSDPAAVRARLRGNFDRRTAGVFASLPAEVVALGWGPRELVTLASIVEEEANARDEQAVIAGVFVNRLLDATFRPHRLQADPTVSYGCRAVAPRPASCAEGGGITRAMLEDAANPYNTYRHEGLPPGPIANPGLDAIRAAVNPARHRYFYFVATGNGRHRFSESLAEHNRAVHGDMPRTEDRTREETERGAP
jgi:UPF0755 protein